MIPVDVVVAGTGGVAVDGVGAGTVFVAEEPELDKRGRNGQERLDTVDQVPAESMGRRPRHGTLRSAPLRHGYPGG
jgi:hypothetical protein